MGTATSSPPMPAAPARQHRVTLPWLAAVALGVIWVAVIVISVFSPDLVTGAYHDHTPLPALITWIWGVIASRSLIATLLAQRGRPERLGDLAWLALGISLAWAVAAVVGVFGPEVVTGTDPTHLPVSALVAPIAAMVVTTTACQVFSALHPVGKTRQEVPASGS